jgi:hypothetical protein
LSIIGYLVVSFSLISPLCFYVTRYQLKCLKDINIYNHLVFLKYILWVIRRMFAIRKLKTPMKKLAVQICSLFVQKSGVVVSNIYRNCFIINNAKRVTKAKTVLQFLLFIWSVDSHVRSCKKLPRTSLQNCYIFLVLRDNWCQHYEVLRIEYRSSRCYGAWGKLHLFSIPHVQTQSNRVCNSYVILLWLMLPRDHFVSRFLSFQRFIAKRIEHFNGEK